MKKRIKTILCLALAGVMLTAAMLPAHALPTPMLIGDVDNDYDLTVLDATRIQRWLAELEDALLSRNQGDYPQKLQEFIGDVNKDRSCDILDATHIQRMLAELEEKMYEDTWAYYIKPTRFYANYNSGKAYVGAPVTFTAEIPDYSEREPDPDNPIEPYTYEFRINGEVVQERSEKNTLTHTFAEAGVYTVSVTFYNALDCQRTNTLDGFLTRGFQVVEPFNMEAQPVIVSALFPMESETVFGVGPLVVRAEGGSGGYQYKYVISDGVHSGFREDSLWHIEGDSLTTGWIGSATVDLPNTEDLSPSCVMTVTARDSSGVCSEPQELLYSRDILVE